MAMVAFADYSKKEPFPPSMSESEKLRYVDRNQPIQTTSSALVRQAVECYFILTPASIADNLR
jgi:hypothetical protein